MDENLGEFAAAVLVDAGFDTATVPGQSMQRTPDPVLIERCAAEDRCLVTLDAEFGNPFLFPPHRYRGIVLLRVSGRNDRSALLGCLATLRDALLAQGNVPGSSIPLPGPTGRLWVVQPGKVRLYQGGPEE
jgi:predicted nuclease of predicted toxin-antitoxin system